METRTVSFLVIILFKWIARVKNTQPQICVSKIEITSCTTKILGYMPALMQISKPVGLIGCARICRSDSECGLAVYQEFSDGENSCTKLSGNESSQHLDVSSSTHCSALHINPCYASNPHVTENPTPGGITDVPASVKDCPSALARDQYLKAHGEFCFRFILDSDSVLENPGAEADCRVNGGTLALVKTLNIQQFLFNQLVTEYNFQDMVWIGLNDVDEEGVYFWSDGTQLNENDYANWGNDEGPENRTFLSTTALASEDCVTMDVASNGLWRDYHCENIAMNLIKYENSYICQYELDSSA